MSDNELDETTDDSSVIQQLRAQLREKSDADRRAQDAERKLAFAEAGIPLDDRVKKYFIPQYDGEMTPDAIRAAAEADGFFQKVEAPQVAQQEQQALRNISDASEGATAPEVLAADDQRDVDLRAAVRNGEIRTPEQIGSWLQSRGQPVAWDGPQPWEDGSQFKPIV